MGDRAQVAVLDTYNNGIVYLYTHWGGSMLGETLAKALDRGRERWDDEPYLTRIIFSEMIRDDPYSLTGHGILSTSMEGPTYIVVPSKKQVFLDDSPFGWTADKVPEDAAWWGFEEFINQQLAGDEPQEEVTW